MRKQEAQVDHQECLGSLVLQESADSLDCLETLVPRKADTPKNGKKNTNIGKRGPSGQSGLPGSPGPS